MADSIKSVDVPGVHGLVALNADGTAIGAPVGGATAANQTDGSQKTQIVDAGGEVATVTGGKLDVNASIDTTGLATADKQDTGNTSLATLASAVDTAKVQVDVITAPTTNVAQSGSWTIVADAGTDLNTSALALDSTLTNNSQKTQIVDASGNAVSVTGGKLDVNSAAPVGGATSANQDTLNALIETLQELVQRLAPLAGAMASTAQLRVIGSVAVTSAPSTAVTGPLTSAQSIAEKATGGIDYTNRIAAMNLNAVQSNINNCVGA